MKEDLKNIILMGLGAMSLTNDKAHELKDELLKRGKDAYEKGRVANEELKHNIEDKIKENVTVVIIQVGNGILVGRQSFIQFLLVVNIARFHS